MRKKISGSYSRRLTQKIDPDEAIERIEVAIVQARRKDEMSRLQLADLADPRVQERVLGVKAPDSHERCSCAECACEKPRGDRG